MTWTYQIHTGRMTRVPGGQTFVGYSGAGHTWSEGRNNPAMCHDVGKGPIPPGSYSIGEPHPSPHTGPYTMNLDALPGTDTFGRSAFRIHGNNAEDDASEGCVIMPPNARKAIWESGDHTLSVVV